MVPFRWLMASVVTLGLLTPVVAAAQPGGGAPLQQGDGTPISLGEALSRAAARSPDALAPMARTALADAEVGVAGMLINPTVSFGMLSAPARLQGGVNFTLPVFGQRGAAVRAAEAGAVAARLDLAHARLDVRTGTATAWLDLWLAERAVETSRDTSTRRARLLAIAEDRLSAGSSPALDVLRARAEAARARADHQASELAVTALARRLAAWMGDDPAVGSSLRATGELPGATAPPALALLAGRLDEHPALAAERARVAELRRRVELERRLRLPMLGVMVGVDEWGIDPVVTPALIGVLSVEVPMFHNHGALIDRAEAALAVQSAERTAARAHLAADLAAAAADYDGAVVRAIAESTDVLPAAQQAADLAAEGYSAGRGDIQSVIAAEQSLTEAHVAADLALASRALAWVRLEAAVGGPL